MSGKRIEKAKELRSQWRVFSLALAVVAFIWFCMAMSDVKPFREVYRVDFKGLDTARYVVTHSDTTVALNVTSNGFHAFRRSLIGSKRLTVNVVKWQSSLTDDGSRLMSVNTLDLTDEIEAQLDMRGVTKVEPLVSTLNVALSERARKAFVPVLDSVYFQFEGTHGLSAQPIIKPDTVYLYGSPSSLAAVQALHASKQTIEHIHRSGNHRIMLARDWAVHPDLRISTPYVTVYVPVEKFIEKSVLVPIAFQSAEPVQEWHLYPANATVRFWIAERDYANAKAEDFRVSAIYKSDSSQSIDLVVSQFPSHVRIKETVPQRVQYTVIR